MFLNIQDVFFFVLILPLRLMSNVFFYFGSLLGYILFLVMPVIFELNCDIPSFL